MRKIPSPLDVKRWIDEKIDAHWVRLYEESPVGTFVVQMLILAIILFWLYIAYTGQRDR